MVTEQENSGHHRSRSGSGILVRTKKDERDCLKQKARAANLTLNDYLIECGLNGDAPPNPRERELREHAVFEIRKVSYNLDRIAKRLNGGSGSSEQVQKAINEAIAAVKMVTEAFIKTANDGSK